MQPKPKQLAPVSVVMGDSLMQGSPGLKGRISADPKSSGKQKFRVDTQFKNQWGQPSGELEGETGQTWLNHGIAGQRSDEIESRWKRDVLAQQSGTLKAPPERVLLSMGSNDFAQADLSQLDQVQRDLRERVLRLIKSSQSKGIQVAMINLPPNRKLDPKALKAIQEFNRWLAAETKRLKVPLFDYYQWVERVTDSQKQSSPLMADHIHPTRDGYREMMRLLMQKFGWSQSIDPEHDPASGGGALPESPEAKE